MNFGNIAYEMIIPQPAGTAALDIRLFHDSAFHAQPGGVYGRHQSRDPAADAQKIRIVPYDIKNLVLHLDNLSSLPRLFQWAHAATPALKRYGAEPYSRRIKIRFVRNRRFILQINQLHA